MSGAPVLEPRTFTVTRADLVAYAEASCDHNPIHQDEEVARSVGLPGVIALAVAAVVWRFGGERPWQEGMPTLREIYGSDETPQLNAPPDVSYWRLVRVHVLGERVGELTMKAG